MNYIYIAKCVHEKTFSYLEIDAKSVVDGLPEDVATLYNNLLSDYQKQRQVHHETVERNIQERKERTEIYQKMHNALEAKDDEIKRLRASLDYANNQIDTMKSEREAMRSEVWELRHNVQAMAY